MNIEIDRPQPGYEKIRRWPRCKIDAPLRLMAQSGAMTTVVQARGREVNCGGMAVFAEIELPNAEQVVVEFTPLHSRQPIMVRGLIRNRSGYTYGIEFVTENDAEYNNVGQLEAALKSRGSGP
jgi:PilZ domain